MVTIDEMLDFLKRAFISEEAKKFKKTLVFQYKFREQPEYDFAMTIDNGAYEITMGKYDKPVVTMSFDTLDSLHALLSGKMDGIAAYTQGLVQIIGPVGLAQKFEDLWNKRA